MSEGQVELASRVGYQDVRDYLKSRGWTAGASRRSYAAIYRSPDREAVEVLVPLDRDLGDYAEAMARLAERVAHYEQRESSAVLRDLTQPRRDILRFALSGERTRAGAVGLLQGESLVTGVRKALLASACSVQRPRKYHPRMSLAEADAFVRSCALGQTELGSFVLTVEAPFDLAHEPEQTPFGRQTTAYLLNATDTLANAVRRGEPELVLAAAEDQIIVSGNLCDALIEMLPSDESADLRLHGSWSPLLPMPNAPTAVHIDRNMYEAIEDIGRQLRPQSGPRADAFLGLVSELSGSPGPSGAVEGEVTLSILIADESETIKARVVLAPEDYRIAADAHLDKKAVLIRGVLHRGRRTNQFKGVSEFSVVT